MSSFPWWTSRREANPWWTSHQGEGQSHGLIPRSEPLPRPSPTTTPLRAAAQTNSEPTTGNRVSQSSLFTLSYTLGIAWKLEIPSSPHGMGSSKIWQRNCYEDIDNSSGQMQGRLRRCNQQVGSVLLQLRGHSNSCNLSRHSGHFTFGLLVRKTTRRDMHTYSFELWEYNCWYLVHHVMLLKRNVCVVRKPLDLAKYNSSTF